MARQVVNLKRLAEAQEAADAAQETAPLAAEKVAEAVSDYDTDVLIWSERQAELLRRVAAGEAPNKAPDWDNIIDEVEALGRAETRACASLLTLVLLHRLKIAAWPGSTAAPGWNVKARRFQWEAIDAFAPSMYQKLNVERLYERALSELRKMPQTVDGQPPLPVPTVCPVTLDELLAEP